MKNVKPIHRVLSESEVDQVAGGLPSTTGDPGGDDGGTGPKPTYDGTSNPPREDYDVGGTWKWRL